MGCAARCGGSWCVGWRPHIFFLSKRFMFVSPVEYSQQQYSFALRTLVSTQLYIDKKGAVSHFEATGSVIRSWSGCRCGGWRCGCSSGRYRRFFHGRWHFPLDSCLQVSSLTFDDRCVRTIHQCLRNGIHDSSTKDIRSDSNRDCPHWSPLCGRIVGILTCVTIVITIG